MILNIKKNDTRTAIKATLKTPNGNFVKLKDANVKFIMASYGTVIVNRDAQIIDEENGVVVFSFNEGETNYVGLMKAEFKVTYKDGSTETFPNSGYIQINIEPNLI